MYHATFSMVARSPETRSLGVCVSTARPAVGNRVPHVEAGVGAIATQANTNITYGINGLKLLGRGFSPQSALDAMLEEDPDRESRQVVIIDKDGRTAAFTGKETIGWRGHLVGKNFVAAGNMLTGSSVIEAMAQAFENSGREDLPERLMKALEAGQSVGGDKRGKVSAALLVASKEQKAKRPFLDLRIDEHGDPVGELRRIFSAYYTSLHQKKGEPSSNPNKV